MKRSYFKDQFMCLQLIYTQNVSCSRAVTLTYKKQEFSINGSIIIICLLKFVTKDLSKKQQYFLLVWKGLPVYLPTFTSK